MVFIAGAVESNLLDPLFLPLDGDALADDLGGLAVAAVLQLGPDVVSSVEALAMILSPAAEVSWA